MKIIFVNHGEESLMKGTLTMKGKLQAFFSRQFLKNEKIDEIFVSPQTRVLQTAKIINKKLNLPLNIIKEFDERGVLKLTQIANLQDEFAKNYLNYDYENKEFETCKKYIDRVFSGIRKVREKKLNCVVIVGHNSTLYAINAYINGIPKDGQIKWVQCNKGGVVKFFI